MLMRIALVSLLAVLIFGACQSTPEEESRDKLLDLYLGNAQLYYQGGHFRSAIAQVDKALALDPENQKGRFVRAMAHLRLKGAEDVQIALSELEQLVEEDFDERQYRVWLGLGMARAAVGDYFDARFRMLEKQIEAEPLDGPELAPRRDKARRDRDRLYRASIEACQKVLSYDDIPLARNDPIALYHIYRNLSLLGKPEEALEYQRRHLAVVEGSRDQWKKAVQEFPNARQIYEQKLRGVRKNEVAVREAMAVTLYELGRYAEAIDHLRRAILLDPERAGLYLNRAQVYRKLGQHAEAVLDLTKFLQKTELTPEDPEAQQAVELLNDSKKKVAAEG